MKFKKIFAAAAACAVATLSAASYAATTVSAATVVGKAMLSGQMGTYSQWKEEDAIANGSTVANIDGNAQYEATWNITGEMCIRDRAYRHNNRHSQTCSEGYRV